MSLERLAAIGIVDSAMVKKMISSAAATVSHCFGGYALPAGLTEGEVVRLLEVDHGVYLVECPDGRRFHVASNCVAPVPSEFFASHRAQTFMKRMRSLFRSGERGCGMTIASKFNHLRFTVFGDDNKPRGFLEIHKDAILNLGSEFRERIVRQLMAMRAR